MTSLAMKVLAQNEDLHPSTDLEEFKKDFELKSKTGIKGRKTINLVAEVFLAVRNRMLGKGCRVRGHGFSQV